MNIAMELGAGLSGIEQLRAMMATGRGAAIAETLQFQLSHVEDGFVVFQGVPGLHAYNPIGMIHGGYAATLLDSACGCAVHTTLELKVSYLRAMTKDTGLVRAEGRVVQFGRRAAFAEARLMDEAGKLYATASSSLIVMDR